MSTTNLLRSALQGRLAVTHRVFRKSLLRQLSTKPDPLANIGEYPTTIPMINRQNRSLVEKWDNQQDRRNFDEPCHEEEEVLTVFGPDLHTHVSSNTALLQIGIFIAAVFGVVGFAHVMYTPLNATRRTYPYNEEELAGMAARKS